jgi:hypothetical protein
MTTARFLTRALPALAALLAGCGDSLPPLVCDGDGRCTQASVRETFQYSSNRKVDLLFVVDDTSAMAPHLDAVTAGFAEMAINVHTPPGPDRTPISLHAGFIRAGNCDTSTRGAACGLASPDQYLQAASCQRLTNLTGAFEATFACLGDLGTTNCGPAQPMSAALQLLTGPIRPGWEGFLRPDAYLAIVIVAATDDASPTPVLDVATRLKALKPDPSQVLVSVIGPWAYSPVDVAEPARLVQLAYQFGSNGLLVPFSADLAYATDRITETFGDSLVPPCLRNLRDADPTQPGLQVSCSVVDHAYDAQTGNGTIAAIPSCDVSAPPCWIITPGGCVDGSNFSIERGPDWCGESGSTDVVECLVCTSSDDPACAPQTP